jgi:three-Cys-motif partner protein
MGDQSEELYAGREQTFVKHFILQRYLERFAHIVASGFDTITYVDCFAGPWQERSANLADTSFSIAIRELKKAKKTHKEISGRNICLRCFFIEKDREAYGRLREFFAKETDVTVETHNGEFETAIPQILTFIKGGGSSNIPFIFVDPTGWTGFPLERIAPLLQLQPVEVLINFMTGDIRRFVGLKDTEDGINKLFGRDDVADRVAGLLGEDRDDALVEIYSEVVMSTGRFKFVLPAIILEPLDNRTRFHLIYCTRNDRGIEVFKKTEELAMSRMEEARATAYKRKREQAGQGYLLGGTESDTSLYYGRLRDRYTKRAFQRLELYISERKSASYDEAWLEAVKFPLTWEKDLRTWIADMKSKDVLRVEGMKPREKVPKRMSGVRLTWMR